MLNPRSDRERSLSIRADVTDIPPAPYLPTSDPSVMESTPLALAGWYEDGQHGGVVAALLARAIERIPTLAPMEPARLTVELFRIVPIVPLRVTASVLREGKRIQVAQASVFDPDGLELARAVGLRLRRGSLDLPATAQTPPLHLSAPGEVPGEEMATWGIGDTGRVLYHRHAIEVREIDHGFSQPGPGAMWLRVVRPLVDGEPITPLTRAVVTGDFVNGLSRLVDARDYVFMNADLSIHLHRLPRGEWVGVEAESRYSESGRGVAGGRLFDPEGEIGRSSQTLFIQPR